MTTLHGTYRARALSGALGYAGNGTEQVGIDFQIIEGPSEGQHITWYGFFTDKTTDRTIESLRICGWEGDDLFDLTGIEKNEVDLVIEAEDYADKKTGELKTRSRVRWINRPSGLQMRDAMDSTQAREFAAKMRGRVVALRGAGQAPAPAPARKSAPAPQNKRGAPAQAVDDDDIPFMYNTLEYCHTPTRRLRWQKW